MKKYFSQIVIVLTFLVGSNRAYCQDYSILNYFRGAFMAGYSTNYYNSIDKHLNENFQRIGMPYIGCVNDTSETARDCEFVRVTINIYDKMGGAAIRLSDCKNNIYYEHTISYLRYNLKSIIYELFTPLVKNFYYDYALKDFKIKPRENDIVTIESEVTKQENIRIASKNPFTEQPVNKKADLNLQVDSLPEQHASPEDYRFALIFGNEDYKNYQRTIETKPSVEFALNDALIFKEYAIRLLRVPDSHIILRTNATKTEMEQAIDAASKLMKNCPDNRGELIVYYSGHGFTDIESGLVYLIPADVSGNDTKFSISVNSMIQNLTKFNNVLTIFIDACYSGGGRSENLVAYRSIEIEANELYLPGNVVVFSSSKGNQPSGPYQNMKHGLFTYYLLNILKESQGRISYGELADHLTERVGINSILINLQEQNPDIKASSKLSLNWRNLTF